MPNPMGPNFGNPPSDRLLPIAPQPIIADVFGSIEDPIKGRALVTPFKNQNYFLLDMVVGIANSLVSTGGLVLIAKEFEASGQIDEIPGITERDIIRGVFFSGLTVYASLDKAQSAPPLPVVSQDTLDAALFSLSGIDPRQEIELSFSSDLGEVTDLDKSPELDDIDVLMRNGGNGELADAVERFATKRDSDNRVLHQGFRAGGLIVYKALHMQADADRLKQRLG
jgi:hypothetical protein